MGAAPLGYVRQLDGIRAVAVLLVIVSHWFPGDVVGKFGFGAIGVDIFFVLSGFLITRILIVERLKFEINPSAHSRLKVIRNFMVRRSLRIFPIYYLLLVLLILFKDQFPNPVSSDWKWYFFYLQNILFYVNQAWPGGKLSHLWSLAVEEQFYLFWPWIILFVSQKWLLKIMVSFFFLGIACVYILPVINQGYNADLLTPSCMQAFSAGGILTYYHVYKKNTSSNYNQIFAILGLLALSILVLGYVGVLPSIVDLRTLISIITVGLISSILYNPNTIYFKYILGIQPVVFLGKISYGVYLLHNFIPLLVNSLLHFLDKYHLSFSVIKYNRHLYNQGTAFYFVCILILFALATISFYTFERPLNLLKKHFI
jgi:peptidoglycan/LPS O-acetylase OafA/YrhL